MRKAPRNDAPAHERDRARMGERPRPGRRRGLGVRHLWPRSLSGRTTTVTLVHERRPQGPTRPTFRNLDLEIQRFLTLDPSNLQAVHQRCNGRQRQARSEGRRPSSPIPTLVAHDHLEIPGGGKCGQPLDQAGDERRERPVALAHPRRVGRPGPRSLVLSPSAWTRQVRAPRRSPCSSRELRSVLADIIDPDREGAAAELIRSLFSE